MTDNNLYLKVSAKRRAWLRKYERSPARIAYKKKYKQSKKYKLYEKKYRQRSYVKAKNAEYMRIRRKNKPFKFGQKVKCWGNRGIFVKNQGRLYGIVLFGNGLTSSVLKSRIKRVAHHDW